MAQEDFTLEERAENSSDLDALFESWMQNEVSEEKSSSTPVPMPEGIDLRRGADSIAIDRRWKSSQFYFTLVFGVIWNIILFPMIGAFLGVGDEIGPFGGFMLVFFLPFIAVGVGMIYYSIAGFLNTTSIAVQNGQISVIHAPVPWPGGQSIPAGDITQLYVKEVRHTSTSSSSGRSGRRRTTYTYTVMVVFGPQNREKTLVRSLSEVNQALFIEYTIERFLGIADRAIRGEIRKA